MGLFLNVAGVIGRSKKMVEYYLREYLESQYGGLEIKELDSLDKNCCIISEGKNGITILYPSNFEDWDFCSRYISTNLECPTFAFHIHDSDFWMYELYNVGLIIDQFNPIPDYWDENISDEEIIKQKGNPNIISELVNEVPVESIQNYFTRWDNIPIPRKAYPDDRFENEDRQLLDFITKIGLNFPLDDAENPQGTVYKLWTTSE